MKELVNLVAEFVGSHTVYKKVLHNTVLMLLERARDMESNDRRRRRKHMGEGIRLAVRIICFELGITWAVAASAN